LTEKPGRKRGEGGASSFLMAVDPILQWILYPFATPIRRFAHHPAVVASYCNR
jgi:hypothetical protein